MKLLEKLFQIISKIVPAELSERELTLLERLNPDKFYVENVRSILGVSQRSAEKICETAVRQGVFQKRVEVKCPDGAVAASADSEENLPQTVRCFREEDGHFEIDILPTADLQKTTFYRLNDKTDSAPYGKTA